MTVLQIAVVLAVGLWVTVLTLELRRVNRELLLMMASVRRLFSPEHHLGGRSASRRHTDFRVPVDLNGYVRVLEHAKPCRLTDLSKTGAQIVPATGTLPVGEHGVLTIEFTDFGSASCHIRVTRFVESTGSYGVQFVDAPHDFFARCSRTVEAALSKALAAP
jgi:hypothetical protein